MAVSRRTAWIVGGVLALAAVVPPVSYADKLSTYQSQEQQLQQQQKSTQTKIATLKSQEQSLQSQVATIEAQVTTLQNQVVASEVQIQKRIAQIDQLKQEIAQTQRKINQQYQVLEERIRVMYEAGNTSYFDVLFSATSFSDLLDRLQLLSMIAQQDKQILLDIEASKQNLVKANGQLQTQLSAQQASYQTLVSKKQQQESDQQKEQSLLLQVHDSRISQEAALRNETSAMQGLRSMIQHLFPQTGS